MCEAIDKLIRDFLWGSTAKNRKVHMVNWSTITLPKDRGGLNLYAGDSLMKVKPLGQRCWQRNASLLRGFLKRARISHVHESGLLARKDLFMSKVSEKWSPSQPMARLLAP